MRKPTILLVAATSLVACGRAENQGERHEPGLGSSTQALATLPNLNKPDCNAQPQTCCPAGSTLITLTQGSDNFSGADANRCLLLLGGDDTASQSGANSAVFGGPGNDTLMAGPSNTVFSGDGDDRIMAWGTGNGKTISGGPGSDNISASGGYVVVPGPGADTASTAGDGNIMAILDLCEIQSGENLSGGSGDTLVTPVPLAQLQSRGVSATGFGSVVVAQNSCRSECVPKAKCSGHGACSEGASTGQVVCACDAGWTGDECDIRALIPKAVQRWTQATSSIGPFGPGAIDDTGAALAEATQSVVAVSAQGVMSTAFSSVQAARFAVDAAGTRFGVYTPTQFQVRNRAGTLLTALDRMPCGIGKLVPGSNAIFLPDVKDGGAGPSTITGARFFNPALQGSFPTTDLQSSRLTSTHLIYSTRSQLVRSDFSGNESFRIPLPLVTFEASSNDTRLIGVLSNQGTTQIVHVDLTNGAVSAPVTLNGAFWSLAAAPGGRFTAATTQKSVYLFDRGQLWKRIDLAVNWAVSVDIADTADVVIGAQLSSHDAQLILMGPGGVGTSTFNRSIERDGFRPYVKFSPTAQRLLLNETSGLTVFDITRAP